VEVTQPDTHRSGRRPTALFKKKWKTSHFVHLTPTSLDFHQILHDDRGAIISHRNFFWCPVNSLAARVSDTLHWSRWNLAGRSGPSWSAQGCGFTTPKTLKIWNFTNIIALRGGSRARFLQNLQRLCASSVYVCQIWLLYLDIRQNYKQFTSVEAFSAKFSMTPSGHRAVGRKTHKSVRE